MATLNDLFKQKEAQDPLYGYELNIAIREDALIICENVLNGQISLEGLQTDYRNLWEQLCEAGIDESHSGASYYAAVSAAFKMLNGYNMYDGEEPVMAAEEAQNGLRALIERRNQSPE